MIRKFIILVLVVMVLPQFAFSQKAFDAVYYSCKTADITIKFMYADGYIEGSEIKIKNSKTNKTSRFLPENGSPDITKQMKFYHATKSGKTFSDYFILKGIEDVAADLPTTISGVYYNRGKAFNFILTKQKG